MNLLPRMAQVIIVKLSTVILALGNRIKVQNRVNVDETVERGSGCTPDLIYLVES